MPIYPMMQVDAFTTVPYGGNPCAVIFDADSMDEATMLNVAGEMNLSETAFVLRSSVADFRARYFTPAEEIPLAGHPTIATVFALIESGRLPIHQQRFSVSLELRDGPIDVTVVTDGQRVDRIIMGQRKPRFLRIYPPEVILPVFNLAPEDIIDRVPIRTVSTGTPQLMVPVRSLDVLRKISLDIPAYVNLRAQGDFFSPHLFTLQGVTPAGRTFARHFGVPPDLPEDPFTGSATGGMAAYLYHYRLVRESSFVAEQGHWMGRPGTGYVELDGIPGDIASVRVGGAAVAVLHGMLDTGSSTV